MSVGCKLDSADKLASNLAMSDNNLKPLIETRSSSFKLFKPFVTFTFSKIIDFIEI